jgi:hypothetical protein
MTTTKISNLLALFVLFAAVLVLLAGCYRMYWNKPSGDLAQFTADHQVCARDSATRVPRNPAYGVVDEKLYRACLQASGWRRAEVMNPVARAEGGWFRGVEDNDVVRLDAMPEQVKPFTSAEKAAACRSGRGVTQTELDICGRQ